MPSSLSLSFHSYIGKKRKEKRKKKLYFPSRFVKLFLPYQKQLSSGEECACRITTIPGGERSLTNLSGFQAAKTPSKW